MDQFRMIAFYAFYILCGLTLVVHTGPAPPISELKLLSCGCPSGKLVCTYRQMGYGSVYESFSGGSVSCSESRRITDWGNTILGWEYACTLGATSGQFEIKTGFSSTCGITYDRVTINNCHPGMACSSFG